MCSNPSTIFPKTLVNNIAFVFTDVQSSPFRDCPKQILGAFKSPPVFLLNNPIVHRGRFGDTNIIEIERDHEQGALEMLLELFNWIDGLEPQPATEITSLYEVYRNIEVILDQRVREVEIDTLTNALKWYLAVSLSLCSHVALESYTRWM